MICFFILMINLVYAAFSGNMPLKDVDALGTAGGCEILSLDLFLLFRWVNSLSEEKDPVREKEEELEKILIDKKINLLKHRD